MHKSRQIIWSTSRAAVTSGHAAAQGKSSVSRRSVVLIAASLLSVSGAAVGADLPDGGSIVGGTGHISQSGNTLTVTQDSARLAADWQSFSIGASNAVNFVQPSASAVALNRVLGSDVSVIQGALHANGQVFLINPNGVLFSPTAQVNVGGIVTSTLAISTTDFMAGNYQFVGASSNAIINQGNITAAKGGTIALIAAKITNQGSLTTTAGNVLLGAGSAVTLDLGGPVKLEVTQGALDAAINQGGVIKADGSTVYLTAKAAGELADSIINHTGIIEAQTLATGEQGQIVLLGDEVSLAGTIDASAPNGGDGGTIEINSPHLQADDSATVSTSTGSGAGVSISFCSGAGMTISSCRDAGVSISDGSGSESNTISVNPGAVAVNSPSTISILHPTDTSDPAIVSQPIHEQAALAYVQGQRAMFTTGPHAASGTGLYRFRSANLMPVTAAGQNTAAAENTGTYGLSIVPVRNGDTVREDSSSSPGTTLVGGLSNNQAGLDPAGRMRLLVMSGGINLPHLETEPVAPNAGKANAGSLGGIQ